MRKTFAAIAVFIVLLCLACNENKDKEAISNDPAVIAKGEAIFNQQCSGCHNFRQDEIGPQLSGITNQQSPHWIRSFINNPQEVINSGDKEAVALYNKYKVTMPSFASLKEDELNGLLAFLNTHTTVGKQAKDEGNSL